MSHRWSVLALVVAACATPPPVPAPAPAPTMSVTPVADGRKPEPRPAPAHDAVGRAGTFLADGWRDREPRRARLVTVPPIYWDLDAAKRSQASVPGTDKALTVPVSLVVVERHPGHLRVVHENANLRVTFYAAVTAFHEVTRQATTLLQSDGRPFADGCGVTVPAGAVLSVQPPQVGFRRVEYRSDRALARGFVPTDGIDRVYLEAGEPEMSHQCDCQLQSPVTLRDGPAGEVVAKLTRDDDGYCQVREPARAGAQKIAIFDGAVTIVGFAPSVAITATKPAKIGWLPNWSSRGRWGSDHGTYVYLWPGDELHRPDGGGQVGQVLARALKVSDDGKSEGSMPLVSLPIHPWDFATLSIQADTLAAAGDKYEAWLGRVRYDKLTVTGSATVADVKRELDSARSGVSSCFDRALAKRPGASFRYEVDIDYAPQRPRPTLTPKGAAHDGLERCLAIRLRGSTRSLEGTRARFTLWLAPAARVDGP